MVLEKNGLGSHLYACVEAAKLLNICMAPPYVLNPFHPKLPLSLLSPVSLPLVCPPRSFLSLTRCLLTSCAQMAERKRRDGFIWRVRALKHPGHAHTHGYGGETRCSGDPGLLSQNLKMSFCFHLPRFHALASYDHVNMKQMPQTHM